MSLSRIRVDTQVQIRHSHRDSRIDQLRAAVIEATKESKLVSEDDGRWINFRPPPPYRQLPKILYGQPTVGQKRFFIYGFGQDGRDILEKIGKSLLKKGTIRVGEDMIGIEDFSLSDDIPFLPAKSIETRHYYTASPVIFYDKRRDHQEWFAITKKFQNSDPDEYDKQMKRSIANLLRSSILYQLRQRVVEGEYKFVKDIDIQIHSFRFFSEKYHTDQPKTPMLMMEFSSSWNLPSFVGHHTGKGYGALTFDRRRERESA